ncbi:MAG: hypothetical protein KIT84_19110 [Labilithrix sp.]|nr:hypothetical protein [Labilithrix sp.]MCW5813145.1 hypothetical protein [Labilithrix sp.]
MTKTVFFALLASFALVTGCSAGDGEITVEAATTPPTDNPNDALFTVKVDDAPEEGYALDGLTVKALRDGKDALTVSCTTTDANSNAKLDKGDSLVCTEGATNVLGADAAGTEIEVELYAKVDDEEKLVGAATWTAAK